MSSMKQTKEGVNLKKLLRPKNTGSIFVIAGLLIIFVIALYTFILQSSYTKTALETEITRDTASADAVHKLVDGRMAKKILIKSTINLMKRIHYIRIFLHISMKSEH